MSERLPARRSTEPVDLLGVLGPPANQPSQPGPAISRVALRCALRFVISRCARPKPSSQHCLAVTGTTATTDSQCATNLRCVFPRSTSRQCLEIKKNLQRNRKNKDEKKRMITTRGGYGPRCIGNPGEIAYLLYSLIPTRSPYVLHSLKSAIQAIVRCAFRISRLSISRMRATLCSLLQFMSMCCARCDSSVLHHAMYENFCV